MLPICMVNEETFAQIPEDVRLYLRVLRRRIIELEKTDPQQRIAELEAANRGLQVELDDALALIAQHKEQIGQLQQRIISDAFISSIAFRSARSATRSVGTWPFLLSGPLLDRTGSTFPTRAPA
jgi:hypothetical protein